MSHHTPSAQEGPANSPVDAIVGFLHELLRPLPGQNEELAAPRRRGRPRDLQSDHLWLAMLVAILRGFTGFAPVWRLITWTGVGHFPVLHLTRAAVRKRLACEPRPYIMGDGIPYMGRYSVYRTIFRIWA